MKFNVVSKHFIEISQDASLTLVGLLFLDFLDFFVGFDDDGDQEVEEDHRINNEHKQPDCPRNI